MPAASFHQSTPVRRSIAALVITASCALSTTPVVDAQETPTVANSESQDTTTLTQRLPQRAAITDRDLTSLLDDIDRGTCTEVERTFSEAPRRLTEFRAFMHTTGFPARGWNFTATQERRMMDVLERRLIDCGSLSDDRPWPARVTSLLSRTFGPLYYTLRQLNEHAFGVTRFD